MVPPFDDRNVIAGQGTIALEIAEDAPDVAVILVPVSGGWVDLRDRRGRRHGAAEREGVRRRTRAGRRCGRVVAAGEKRAWEPELTARTIADGLRTFSGGELSWQHIRSQVHDIITVTEDEIRDATRRLTLQAHLAAEPSGAVATAAHLHHSDQLPAGKRVAIVSGGNINPAVLRDILS